MLFAQQVKLRLFGALPVEVYRYAYYSKLAAADGGPTSIAVGWPWHGFN
jgi:hypothetical protein